MSLTVTINFIVLKMAVVVYVIDGYNKLYCPENGRSGICH